MHAVVCHHMANDCNVITNANEYFHARHCVSGCPNKITNMNLMMLSDNVRSNLDNSRIIVNWFCYTWDLFFYLFQTHPSVRVKGTENNYNPVMCLDATCGNRNPHMHCPFCLKSEYYHDPVILKAHYRVKHVDKGIDFAGMLCFHKFTSE